MQCMSEFGGSHHQASRVERNADSMLEPLFRSAGHPSTREERYLP
jgi:hypothetical protein